MCDWDPASSDPTEYCQDGSPEPACSFEGLTTRLLTVSASPAPGLTSMLVRRSRDWDPASGTGTVWETVLTDSGQPACSVAETTEGA